MYLVYISLHVHMQYEQKYEDKMMDVFACIYVFFFYKKIIILPEPQFS